MHFIEYTHIFLDKCKEKAQKTCSKNFHSPLILQMQAPLSLYHHNCNMVLIHDTTRHNKLKLRKVWFLKDKNLKFFLGGWTITSKKKNQCFLLYFFHHFACLFKTTRVGKKSKQLILDFEANICPTKLYFPTCFSQLCQAQWNALLSLLSTWFHPLLKIIWT